MAGPTKQKRSENAKIQARVPKGNGDVSGQFKELPTSRLASSKKLSKESDAEREKRLLKVMLENILKNLEKMIESMPGRTKTDLKALADAMVKAAKKAAPKAADKLKKAEKENLEKGQDAAKGDSGKESGSGEGEESGSGSGSGSDEGGSSSSSSKSTTLDQDIASIARQIDGLVKKHSKTLGTKNANQLESWKNLLTGNYEGSKKKIKYGAEAQDYSGGIMGVELRRVRNALVAAGNWGKNDNWRWQWRNPRNGQWIDMPGRGLEKLMNAIKAMEPDADTSKIEEILPKLENAAEKRPDKKVLEDAYLSIDETLQDFPDQLGDDFGELELKADKTREAIDAYMTSYVPPEESDLDLKENPFEDDDDEPGYMEGGWSDSPDEYVSKALSDEVSGTVGPVDGGYEGSLFNSETGAVEVVGTYPTMDEAKAAVEDAFMGEGIVGSDGEDRSDVQEFLNRATSEFDDLIDSARAGTADKDGYNPELEQAIARAGQIAEEMGFDPEVGAEALLREVEGELEDEDEDERYLQDVADKAVARNSESGEKTRDLGDGWTARTGREVVGGMDMGPSDTKFYNPAGELVGKGGFDLWGGDGDRYWFQPADGSPQITAPTMDKLIEKIKGLPKIKARSSEGRTGPVLHGPGDSPRYWIEENPDSEYMSEGHPARRIEDLAEEMGGAENGVPATAQAELVGIADKHATERVDLDALSKDIASWQDKWGERIPSDVAQELDYMLDELGVPGMVERGGVTDEGRTWDEWLDNLQAMSDEEYLEAVSDSPDDGPEAQIFDRFQMMKSVIETDLPEELEELFLGMPENPARALEYLQNAEVPFGLGSTVEGWVEDLRRIMGEDFYASTDSQSYALVAAGTPIDPDAPPVEHFMNPKFSAPTALTIDEDGRVYGHLALWGTCHISHTNKGQCITPPKSSSGYAYFRTGSVVTKEGREVPVGHLTIDVQHAKNDLGPAATLAHYDHTGTVVADVAVGEDKHGIWFSGSLRPGLSPSKVRALRSAPLSGDWRRIGTGMELVAAIGVNVPGFPVPRPRGLVASGQMMSLVAAGMLPPRKVRRPGTKDALSREDLRYLKRLADRERHHEQEQLAAKRAEKMDAARTMAMKLKVQKMASMLRKR